jgi:hypothetical protein
MFPQSERIVPWVSDTRLRRNLSKTIYRGLLRETSTLTLDELALEVAPPRHPLLLPLPVFQHGAEVAKVWVRGDPRHVFRYEIRMRA